MLSGLESHRRQLKAILIVYNTQIFFRVAAIAPVRAL